MNRENLLLVADALDGVPFASVFEPNPDKLACRFNMSTVNCGSCACIAGWTVRVLDPDFLKHPLPAGMEGILLQRRILSHARMLLEISELAADALFAPEGWETTKADGIAAAHVLRHVAELKRGTALGIRRIWARTMEDVKGGR